MLCKKLGATSGQAPVLAAQLLKRSEQMATERSIKQVEALEYLLRVMVSGRQGIALGESPPQKGSSPDDDSKKSE